MRSTPVARPKHAIDGGRQNVANLVAIAFPEPSKAFDLRARLVELQKEYLIEMEDIVVVTRDDKGKTKLHQAANLTAVGAVGGGFWGMLIGMLFLNPLVGFAVGAGAGALSGYLSDIGINDEFMKKLGQELKPGGAAVFVLVRKATGDKILDRLKDFAGTGTILQSSLSKDNEEELRKVFEKIP
jgi:uncharacterized membrane protein